jgi:DNA modification methylase
MVIRTIYTGNSLDVLKTLPDQSVQMCVTSPPILRAARLRNGRADWFGADAAGAKPVFSSEIEEFPIAVCKKHFGDEDTGERGDIHEILAR